jgi:hypothetical protein
VVNDQIAKDIISHLFVDKNSMAELEDLAAACERLESSMEKMMRIEPRTDSELQNMGNRGDDAEQGVMGNMILGDTRFQHSWILGGPTPGWYWILKKRLALDVAHPTKLEEVRRFGHLACKVRVTTPPKISQSFDSAVMAGREPPRLLGKQHQED